MPFVPLRIAPQAARLLFLGVRSTFPLLANSSQPQNRENAINGRISLPDRQYRLAEASGSCQAMYRPGPGAVQPLVPDNPKSAHAPGPRLARIMAYKKHGSPPNRVSPNTSFPTNPVWTERGSAGDQVPGEGRPAGRWPVRRPLFSAGRPTVNCILRQGRRHRGGRPGRAGRWSGKIRAAWRVVLPGLTVNCIFRFLARSLPRVA